MGLFKRCYATPPAIKNERKRKGKKHTQSNEEFVVMTIIQVLNKIA
jgi:hypothetical protein